LMAFRQRLVLCMASFGTTRAFRPLLLPHRTGVVMCEGCDAEEQYCTTAQGVKYIDTKVGDGSVVEDGSVVQLNYICTLLSTGRVIHSTRKKGPMRFAVGPGRLAMWEDAVQGMRVGGERRILIPPSASLSVLGSASDLVPKGDTIAFNCELVGIESGLAAAAVRNGFAGTSGSGGARIRLLLLLLSSLPYLLPDELRPFLWRTGSTGRLLQVSKGDNVDATDDSPQAVIGTAEALLDSDALSRELYAGR